MTEKKIVDRKPVEMIIFTFCYHPIEQTMTFAGNISIIDAARLLQNKVFDSIASVTNEQSAEAQNNNKQTKKGEA